MATPTPTRFFIAKCLSFDHLKRCQATSIWACSERKMPPQPHDILSAAFRDGRVVLIFSVNNCHGWHGAAALESPPGSIEDSPDSKTIEPSLGQRRANVGPAGPALAQRWADDTLLSGSAPKNMGVISPSEEARVQGEILPGKGNMKWHKFKIKWEKLYLSEHGEQCLSFTRTEQFVCSDGSPVNKARNYQEVSFNTGMAIYDMLCRHHGGLTITKVRKAAERKEKQGPAFFSPVSVISDPEEVWAEILKKVEHMGKVLMACAFGSQRYNLHTPASDMDMFIVYQANTRDLLGFSPPQGTIKNREGEVCDYTVHELHRFCELLRSGDPRCVETLFLHPSSVYAASAEWETLLLRRSEFLTRELLNKYLRDATGSKGLKLLQKWKDSGEASKVPMTPKVGKLFYIILRLLQNARDVVTGDELVVYRAENSPERKLLMSARHQESDLESLQSSVDRLLEDISAKEKARWPQEEDGFMASTTTQFIEDWLIRLRYHNLQNYMDSADK